MAGPLQPPRVAVNRQEEDALGGLQSVKEFVNLLRVGTAGFIDNEPLLLGIPCFIANELPL